MKILIIATLTLIGLAAPAAGQLSNGVWPNPRECANIDPTTQRRCIGRRIEAKDRLVQQLYRRALMTVRSDFAKWGKNDSRLGPRNFMAADRDWRRFIASNCRAVGAIGGGSGSAISDRITECHERELDERIQLYRHIAEGSYGL